MRLTPLVKNILRNSEKARNSDTELLIEVMRNLGFNLTEAQEDKFRSISFESITRCRRKIQEGGEFLPNPEVAKMRRLKSYIVEQNAPTANVDRLEKLTQEVPQAISWLND